VPDAASGFNFGISVKLTLNDFTLRSDGTLTDAFVVVVVAALGVLLHAVNTMPTTTAREIPASRLNPRIRIVRSPAFYFEFLLMTRSPWKLVQRGRYHNRAERP